MLKIFLGIVLLTSAINSMSTSSPSAEFGLGATEVAVLETSTTKPTLSELAKTLNILLNEQAELKKALFARASSSTTTHGPLDKLKKSLSFLGHVGRGAFQNLANAAVLVHFISEVLIVALCNDK